MAGRNRGAIRAVAAKERGPKGDTMSTEKRVTFDAYGEPVVTITIKGWHDAFRFAWAMAHLQTDFSGVGRRIGSSLRRRLGAAKFKDWQLHFTGGETYRWARDDGDLIDVLDAVGGIYNGKSSGVLGWWRVPMTEDQHAKAREQWEAIA